MTWHLDTNICIECLRGTSPLLKQALQNLEPSRIKIPSMVRAELFHGAAKSAHPERNRELVELFLAPFESAAFDSTAATEHGRIRSELEAAGQIIGFHDLIIAATVVAHEGTLVSSNLKEFSRIDGLQLENWLEMSTAR